MIDYTLEEDLPEEFKGGKLRLNPNEGKCDIAKAQAQVPAATDSKDNTPRVNNSNNNCHWSNTFISPLTSIPNKITETLWNKKSEPESKETVETNKTKENTIQPAIHIIEDPFKFFTFRENVIESAVRECTEHFLDPEADGPLISYFLLTQINHWDTEKERLILLTPKTIVTAKYDFIALRRLGYKKLPLELLEQVIIGNLIYPQGSLIPDRKMKGLRLIWDNGKPSNFGGTWNPFNDDIPFITYTFHPLYFHKDWAEEKQKNVYNLEIFTEMLCEAIANLQRIKPEVPTRILQHNILLQNYIGLGSLIHNRNSLGFFKVRGKFSF